MRQEQPYYSETYRMMAKISGQGHQNHEAKGQPKFLPNRQTPGSLSLASRLQYNDSAPSQQEVF